MFTSTEGFFCVQGRDRHSTPGYQADMHTGRMTGLNFRLDFFFSLVPVKKPQNITVFVAVYKDAATAIS